MSEAWFPELERVLSSGKDEYFCPENTGVFGVQLLPRINTARLGSRLLVPHQWTGAAGPPACAWLSDLPGMAKGLRGLFQSHCDNLSASSLTPLSLLDMGIPWTQKLENKDAKQLPSPLPSPLAECIVTIHVTKWSNDDHIWTFLFEKRKKKKSNTLFLNSVSKFTFA